MLASVARGAAARTLVVAALAFAGLAAPPAVGPAHAGCAAASSNHLNGYIVGQDNYDVNVSYGFSVVDSAGRKLYADPTKSNFGCVMTGGGYSLPQKEINHWLTGKGAPQRTLMRDGTYSSRFWSLEKLPSNAAKVWIEVYSRGWNGSFCKDSTGKWCFNPSDTSKYGYTMRAWVPVNTVNIWLRMPMNCGVTSNGVTGSNGAISAVGRTASGSYTRLSRLVVWTMLPGTGSGVPLHGWGMGKIDPTYPYLGRATALASGQKYWVWGYDAAGKRVIVKDVTVTACKTTRVYITF